MQRVNVIGIDTDRGYRIVELLHGDLLSGAVDADVLVVSAFEGSYVPTPGTLVAGLKHTYGVDLAEEAGRPAFDLRAAFGCWVTDELHGVPSFGRVLVVEMPWGRPSARRHRTAAVLDSINHVFVTLAALEAKGVLVASVAMPVLGAGAQRLDPARVIPVMLRESEKALRRQAHLERVSFVEIEGVRAGELSAAMDATLSRAGVTLPRTELIASLKTDLANAVGRVANRVPVGHAPLLRELHRLASDTTRSAHEVGLIGRRLVEFVVGDLLAKRSPAANLAGGSGGRGRVAVDPRLYAHASSAWKRGSP